MKRNHPEDDAPLLSIASAQGIILESVPTLATEVVAIGAALGRICAEEIRAPWDLPVTDNSAMDGYAYSFDGAGSGTLKVAGRLHAGERHEREVGEGEAVRIMTGAPIPPGCDTVVPVEDVAADAATVRFLGKAPRRGANVRMRGEDVREGTSVIPAGATLRPPEIAMLASLGRSTVGVRRRARVAILATGDELLEAGSRLVPGKVINSNSPCLAAQVLAAGAEPVVIGTAQDDLEDTARKMREGLEADCLITAGGVSMGDRDFVKEVVVGLGGDLRFWRVAIKPGKPVAFALVNGTPVFSLPGNPVSVFVSFEQFVRPALLRMMGHRRLFRPVVKAFTDEPLRNGGDRLHLVRGTVRLDAGHFRVTTTGDQGSGRISSLLFSNGLIVLPPNAELPAGAEVSVQLFDRDFEMGEASPFSTGC